MKENVYYHIHRIDEEKNADRWHEKAIINIGDEYNLFYKKCIEFEAKISKYEGIDNVPWRNVYEYALKNKKLFLPNVYILLNAVNHIINEYQMLLRENAYEKIRNINFNNLPSRTRCIWLCKEKQLSFWKNQLKGYTYKVFMVRVFGPTFKSSNDLLASPSDSYEKIQNEAIKYWEYKESEEKETDEYLYVGKIEILKEIS